MVDVVANRRIGRGSLGALTRQLRRATVAVIATALLAGSVGAAPAVAAAPKSAPRVAASPTVSYGGSCQLSSFAAAASAAFVKPRATVTASPSFDPKSAAPTSPLSVHKYRTPTTSHIVPGPTRNSPVTGYSLTTVPSAVATLSISGTVTGPDAAPVGGITVLAYGSNYNTYDATTAGDGTYSVDVAAGTYLLYFYDEDGAHPAGYYSATGFVADYHDAKDLVVGASKTGIDIQLPAPIWITGRITAAGGVGLGNITVAASSSALDNGGSTKTADDGTYAIAVTPGSYLVGFSDSAGIYASGYYSASGYAPSAGGASDVVVTAADVSGIDVELPVGIHITGVVTSPAGAPLQDIAVYALGNSSISIGTTGADGSYSLVVVADSYLLAFLDPSSTYPVGFYSTSGFKASMSGATEVVVTTADVTGIDMRFPTPVYLQGTVMGPGSDQLTDIAVVAINNSLSVSTKTGPDGAWSIPVAAGSYLVGFSDTAQVYADGYYSTTGYQWDRSLASSVAVTTATVPGLDVHLPLVAHIEGVVTGPDDAPLPDMEVSGYGPSGAGSLTITDADGHYSLPAWHASYRVGVADPAGIYVSGYYATGGFTTNANAASLVAVAAADVTGINMKLPEPVYIRGTVTGPGGAPLEGIDVIADSQAYSTGTTTGADGTFATSVVAGTYRVSYCDQEGVYGSGYYSGTGTGLTTDPFAAMPVTVTTTDTTGIDAELPLAVHIRGTVTGTGGVPLSDIEVMTWTDTTMVQDTTAADGTYALVVNPGTYYVGFSDWDGVYADGYYGLEGFTTDSDFAAPVTVTDVDVTGIDVQMTPLVLPTAHIRALPTWTAAKSISVHWSATQGTNPIEGYDVRYRRAAWNGSGFGSYVTWKNETYSTGASLAAAAGSTYCFSTRAVDWNGNESAWTAETCTAVPLDDRSLTRGSGWSKKTGSSFYRSTSLLATRHGAKLTASHVTARRIAVVATTCSTCGSIKVYWGSTLLKTISLKSSKTVNKKVITVVTWTAAKTGTLTIKVASRGKRVIIDGVGIRRN